ncbi:uncharacterized protein UV8b_01854 [Ustilaginoidea virens]|uniref:Dehydrogenase FUB6 n=1 Tax=Ustilaginoidea virens TaxID=1159556 RepID=A0A063BQY9_USTVR|nr:uncharacterized protein UV8b_01854 [Ustilaginoidea virens]QUC17613.1 hypothetical protein UV8b_01854 [Ustilaginoidea virens]GAO18687.1 hypothetical protein UVI_02058920 [Ustilaginoidea virens]
MTANSTLVYKSIPKGYPVPGQDVLVETREIDLNSVPPGGLLVAVFYASLDPYLRGKMRDPSIPSYTPAYTPDEPIANDTIAKVLKSDHPDFRPGDMVKSYGPIAEYAAIPDPASQRVTKIHNPYNLDLALFLGPLGMPGLTAWSSLYEIGRPKKGETILVSSAAGAVGQLVGQMAKKEGLRVVGSVGSDEKLDFITRELGFDGGFNYKRERPADALKRLASDGIDIYYDNVGGEHLEAALDGFKDHGRAVACGMISQYNTEEPYPIRNLMQVVTKQLTIRGFVVGDSDFGPAYHKEHQEKLQKWLADGSFKAKLHFIEGIDNAAEGLVGIFRGENFGKAVLRIK